MISKNIAKEIIDYAHLKKKDIVLEVGPGKGVLTEELIKKAGKVIAVEKDAKLCLYLKEKFKSANNLEIICSDILKFNPLDYQLKAYKYKIVANLPYYLTSRFLRRFLQSEFQPSMMVLMVQKEVAERIMTKENKESILSLSVKAYGNPQLDQAAGFLVQRAVVMAGPCKLGVGLVQLREILDKTFVR